MCVYFVFLINLTILIVISLFYMFKKNALLSAYVLAPLPLLAFAMYYVNSYINKKSEKIQAQLSTHRYFQKYLFSCLSSFICWQSY